MITILLFFVWILGFFGVVCIFDYLHCLLVSYFGDLWGLLLLTCVVVSACVLCLRLDVCGWYSCYLVVYYCLIDCG